MKMHKYLTRIVSVVILCSSFAFGVNAKELTYAVGFPTGAAPDAARVYAKAVKKYTNDDFSLRVFDLSLLSLSEMSSGINHGITDIGYVLAPYFPSEYPHIIMASELSMLLELDDDLKSKQGLAYAGAMAELIFLNCPECNKEFSNQNQVYTGGAASGIYRLLCNKPITTLKDLKGARIRAGGSAWARWASHFDASSVSLSGNEVFEALNQGVVDCAAISATELSGLNLKDAVTDITMNIPGGVFAAGGTANINQSVWKEMTEEQRKGMLHAGAVLAAEISYNYETYGKRDLEAAKAEGVEIHTAGPAVVKASQEYIRESSDKIAENYSQKYGMKRADELLDTMRPLVERWISLVEDIDNSEELAELYWQEVYSKVDVNVHGMD